MAVAVLHYRVRDVEQWKRVFDERHDVRKERGATQHWVYQSVDDPRELVVSLEFPSADQARAFVADPGLREAMQRGGVEGSPTVVLTEQFESVTY